MTARDRNKLLVLLCVALALVVGGTSSLSIALPEIARDLEATQTQQTWIIDAYVVTFAGLLLGAGALGDRYGRRGVLLGGLAVFGGAFAAAAQQTAPGGLIATGAVAGIGAAAIMPVTLSVITTSFPPEQRDQAVGIWAGVAGAGAIIGLLVAGALLEVTGWQAIYLVYAVAAALVALAALRVVPASRDDDAPPLDLPGTALSALGLGVLVFAIIEAPIVGYGSAQTIATLAVAVVLLALFVVRELRTDAPLLDVRLFANRGFSAGALTVGVQFFAAFGFFFAIAQFTQLVLGYSTLEAAAAVLPMGIAINLVAPQAPKLAERIGHRVVLPTGLALMGCGLLLLAGLGPDSSYGELVTGLMPFGLGFGLAAAPATTAIVASLPREKQGVASAVNDTSREVGAALGLALLGSALSSRYRDEIAPVAADLPGAAGGVVAESPAAGLGVAEQLGARGTELAVAVQGAFADGWWTALVLGACALFLAAVVIAALAPRRAVADDDRQERSNASDRVERATAGAAS